MDAPTAAQAAFDWFDAVKSVLSLLAIFGLPLLAKKNARLAKILGAVITGVVQADHGPTQEAVMAHAEKHDVDEHVEALMANVPKKLPTNPTNLGGGK